MVGNSFFYYFEHYDLEDAKELGSENPFENS